MQISREEGSKYYKENKKTFSEMHLDPGDKVLFNHFEAVVHFFHKLGSFYLNGNLNKPLAKRLFSHFVVPHYEKYFSEFIEYPKNSSDDICLKNRFILLEIYIKT